MRRVPLFLLFLLPFTTMASAQTTAPFDPTRSTTTMLTASLSSLATPDMVVARVMSFDRDKDGRVVKSELPERMQNLLAGDVSGDGALDRAEIRALARPAPPEPPVAALMATAPGARGGGGGGYTFGDQVSLSTRSHVEGALDDLRLEATTRTRALGIVRPFMDSLEADASAVLFNDLEGILTPSQLNNFKSAINLQMRTTPQVITRPDGGRATFFIRRGPDPAQLLNVFGLAAEQKQAALNALDGFKARIRPADADRAALLDELKGVLGTEERENFGAALQRRPLVKANQLAGIVQGLPGRNLPPGLRFDSVEVEGPAVRRLLLTPERQVVEP